jgi:glycosyltransferase involved in cell wall biosynthesis
VADIEAPVVFVEHGSPPGHLFDNETAYHLWKLMHAHHAEDYGRLRTGDAILSISRYIENTLPKEARAYSTVLHHGADHYRKAHLGERLRFRFEHGVGHDDVLIMWVGRMQFGEDEQPYKGFSSLLKMLPAIKGIRQNVKIAFLGKIAEEDITRLACMGVIVLPNFPTDRMGTAYAAADVLLNLSQWEGFNLALVESQLQGTPCIAYDVGPHAEVTAPGRSALLVPDADGILPALTRLVTDAGFRAGMREHALVFAESFRWQDNARALEALLEGCLQRYHATPRRARSEWGLLRVPLPNRRSQSGRAFVPVVDWAPV